MKTKPEKVSMPMFIVNESKDLFVDLLKPTATHLSPDWHTVSHHHSLLVHHHHQPTTFVRDSSPHPPPVVTEPSPLTTSHQKLLPTTGWSDQ